MVTIKDLIDQSVKVGRDLTLVCESAVKFNEIKNKVREVYPDAVLVGGKVFNIGSLNLCLIVDYDGISGRGMRNVWHV